MRRGPWLKEASIYRDPVSYGTSNQGTARRVPPAPGSPTPFEAPLQGLGGGVRERERSL